MTKEEKKDELKNRISMALKDPILQQGFEIICKENAELKADNTEWEKTSDKWKSVYYLTNDQLTKAKEIIKSLLPMASNFVFSTLPKLDEEVQLYRQAEQFLSEEENEQKEKS